LQGKIEGQGQWISRFGRVVFVLWRALIAKAEALACLEARASAKWWNAVPVCAKKLLQGFRI
jgi:hypothetical protein